MNILLWRTLLSPYHLAVRELEQKFRYIMDESALAGVYCPIYSVNGRVKSISSIIDKMNKKNIPESEIEERIIDLCGLRIICQFVEDIDCIVDMIKAREDLTVLYIKDYVMQQKESGYRSYHVIADYTVHTLNGPKTVKVEIQIRTMAMDMWATIEHSLQYKYKSNIPVNVRECLGQAAAAIQQVDNEMSFVRGEIMDAQLSSQMKHRLVTDILGIIERLYRLANKREVEKIQDEFFQIYSQNNLDQLKRFYRELNVIAEGYRAQGIIWDE